VAERVVVYIKDKVGLAGVDLESTGMLRSDENMMKDEAVEALVTLGYTPADATAALQEIDPQLPTEDRIKQALKGTGK
jgi:Holliday junction DNA helicase RuvA